MPAVVAVRTEIQALLPPKVKLAPKEFPAIARPTPIVDPSVEIATKLIIRWEISSRATYERKYMGIVCPPGASGPTWGVGYDGGHQTRVVIAGDWHLHPQVSDLVNTSGQMGSKCKPSKAALAHVRTPYALAYDVFAASTLPRYKAAARRAVGPIYDELEPGFQAALDDLGYNRGWSLLGQRRAEMATIVKVCAPARDAQCAARELRKMCRLWPDTPGLCNRRLDEATVATTPI